MMRPVRLVCAGLATIVLYGCGGDDGPPSPPNPPRATTFVGDVSTAGAAVINVSLNAARVAAGQTSVVQVCVAGTNFCTTVDEDGSFTLAADVGGDVELVFGGPRFSARLPLDDVPRGATVRIGAIVCDPRSGACQADSVSITPAENAVPDCSGAEARPAVLWPPNHRMARIAIIGVTDPDGDPVAITATDVAQDEAQGGGGSGNTAPDAQLQPLAVRAERSGQGDGRTYAISFVADDGRGGLCSGVVYVCVPHDRGKGATCG